MSDLARPDGPGSSPDGLSPSVSGHSPCDPSRTHWQPIATAPKERKTILLIASYPYGSGGWSDPWAGWWDGRSWARWPHAFDPQYWAPITMPDAPQGMAAAKPARRKAARPSGKSPVGRETDAPEELQAKTTQNRDEVRV